MCETMVCEELHTTTILCSLCVNCYASRECTVGGECSAVMSQVCMYDMQKQDRIDIICILVCGRGGREHKRMIHFSRVCIPRAQGDRHLTMQKNMVQPREGIPRIDAHVVLYRGYISAKCVWARVGTRR